MPIIETKTGKKILKKAKSIWVFPYVYNETLGDYVLGQNVYDLSSIIGDSIAIEQNDGETQTKENELTGEKIVINVSTGEWKVTAQCLDLQNSVLRALFGAYFNTDTGIAALRGKYETMYALIRIRFLDTNTPDVYLPKVKMNNKLMIQQLKTRGGQGNISGTALPSICSVVDVHASESNGVWTPGTLHQFSDDITGEPLYQVRTPLMFVPQNNQVLFINHNDTQNEEYVFDEILATIGNYDCCSHNWIVSYNNRSVYSK